MFNSKPYIMKLIKLLFVVLSIGIFASCEEEIKPDSSDVSIVGYAQKGQFIKGSAITAYALDNKLQATGASFPSTIKENLGNFNISSTISAPYLELRAEGYYFIENTSNISAAPIYLNALAKTSQSKVNINLLTTLTSGRIRKLLSEGKTFDVAKQQAESELVSILNFKPNDINVSFDKMNISEDGIANAALLAASCLIQNGRNEGEVQKIISDISAEFEEDGRISDRLRKEIFDKGHEISIPDIVENLISYYNKNGVTDYKIPPFYSFVDEAYSKGFHILDPSYTFVGGSSFNCSEEGGMEEYHAVTYEDITTESDVEWLSADLSEEHSQLYKLKINTDPNISLSEREGHLYVKSKNGEVLYTETKRQRGNAQYIYIDGKSHEVGDIFNVNGKDYIMQLDALTSNHPVYIKAPKSDTGYGISNMSDMVVAAKNNDVSCATITYKPEIDECIKQNGTFKSPFYVALKPKSGQALENPAFVAQQKPVCALLGLKFKRKDISEDLSFAKLKVEFQNEGFLSGEVTTYIHPDEDQALQTRSYTIPETEYRNKSNCVVVNNTNGDNEVTFYVHPQTVTSIRCTAYAADGMMLFETNQNISAELTRGTYYLFNFTIE